MSFELHFTAIQKAYESVPGLSCTGCKGECCVSPTMTAAEFILMMDYVQKNWSEQDWIQLLNTPSLEHLHWHGNSYCRFQSRESGYCLVYPGRALACRLHGHDALKNYATPDSVFCDYNPDKEQKLNTDLLERLLEPVRTGIDTIGAPNEAPFYFVSLNLESWLDFYFHPELAKDRPQLEKCWMDLRSQIRIDKCSEIMRTTLDGKLNTIEKAFASFIEKDYQTALAHFQALQSDFPSVGTYFVTEASMWEDHCKDLLSES